MRLRFEENVMKKLCAFLALVLSLVFAMAQIGLIKRHEIKADA